MTDILAQIATSLAKQGAPVLGGLIGTAIGGPAGAAIGGMAGKALEAVADAFGVQNSPEAVRDALARPDAPEVVARVEGDMAAMIPIWSKQLEIAQEAQRAEIERGFGSWNARRNAAHYVTWGLTAVTGWAVVVAVFAKPEAVAALATHFGACMTLTMAWLAVNSGGKAVADFAREWRGGK